MTTIDDKAVETPDIDLAKQSAPGVYRLLTRDLVDANELTDEDQFPEFGDFLEVKPATGQDDTGIRWSESTLFVQCPAGLARWLVEAGIETGDAFRIISVQKVDGEFVYSCERVADVPVGEASTDGETTALEDAM